MEYAGNDMHVTSLPRYKMSMLKKKCPYVLRQALFHFCSGFGNQIMVE